MLHVDVGFEESARLQLSHALLLYTQAGFEHRDRVIASLNPVEVDPETGAAVILPGAAPDRATVEALLHRMLGTGEELAFLPERVLALDPGRVVWFRASAPAPIHFLCRSPALEALSGRLVRHPSLVFHAAPGALRVFAVAGRARPGPGTPALRAPYWNLYPDGRMCPGNVALPARAHPEEIGAWEDCFFGSSFTHPLGTGPLCAHPGGHDALWLAAARHPERPFPARYLAPLGASLGRILADARA